MIPISTIHKAVCEYYDIPLAYPFQKGRKEPMITYRQIIQYLAYDMNKTENKKYGGISLEKVGEYYFEITGNTYKYCTVLHSCKKIQGYLHNDEQIINDIDFIKKSVNESVDVMLYNYRNHLKKARYYRNKIQQRKKLKQTFAEMQIVA